MRGLDALILATAVLLPAGISAQVTLEPGARVRINLPGRTITGALAGAVADSVGVIDGAGQRQMFDSSAIDSLQVSLGRERHFLRYFGITTGVAAAVGGVISAATWHECNETGFMACFMEPDNRGEAAFLGVAVGALIGVPIGALIGATARRERWSTVYMERDAGSHVSLTADRSGRFTVSATIPLRTADRPAARAPR